MWLHPTCLSQVTRMSLQGATSPPPNNSRLQSTHSPLLSLLNPQLKGSLHTYLNAFTYPDRTCYPVASQNTKDFYNLIHVYLDAVLHPRAVNDPLVRLHGTTSRRVAGVERLEGMAVGWLRRG